MKLVAYHCSNCPVQTAQTTVTSFLVVKSEVGAPTKIETEDITHGPKMEDSCALLI